MDDLHPLRPRAAIWLGHQSFRAWFGEYGILFVISLLTTVIFFMIIFALVRRAPRSWWAWATGATAALLALMIMVSPVFISPLFNKYQPMAAGPLRDQILTMAHAQKIPADNVYVFDASKQTKRISANVSGLGPTIRISLIDNLLNRSTPAGIKAVMGHEMGHYVLGHIGSLIAWFSAIAFGLEVAREPDGFAMTAMQLSEYRKIEPTALEEILFYDHPSGRTRVKMAMEWKARHLTELPMGEHGAIVMKPVAAEPAAK